MQTWTIDKQITKKIRRSLPVSTYVQILLMYDIDLLTVKEFNGLSGKVSAVILKGISELSSQRLKRLSPKFLYAKAKRKQKITRN